MRVTVQRLRRWIVGAAVLLLAVVAGFFIYGRSLYRHIEKDLPGRLGVNIQQTATGFSYTQSSQGHALFTLKASKELQMRSGHVLLHDVDITLYGPPGSNRTDRIYGSDFDYDQNQGVIVSQGDVNIELQGTAGSAPANAAASDAGNNTIRVRTRGLTFLQKTGEASTPQPVEFQLPRAAGTAVGADYNSKTGVVILNSQVHIITSSNGKAAIIEAVHATLLRTSDQAFLVSPTLNYEAEDGSSDQATVYFRKDGTTQRVDANGHVRLKTDTGATVDSETARILLDAKSQPTQADLGGGVQFASARANETMHGSANNGTLLFAAASGDPNAKTALRHGEFRQDVSFQDDLTGLANDPRGRAQKQMHAEKVDVEFAPPQQGHQLEAQRAFAEGNPVVTTRQMPSKGPEQTTRVSGDHLVAALGEGNTLRQLDGTGNTQVAQTASDGSHDTTRGDVLHATFVEQPAPVKTGQATRAAAGSGGSRANGRKAKAEEPKMQTTLETAIQDGNVVLTDTPAKKPGSATQPATLTGWAQHAEYHASDQVLHMTGSPRITDAETMQVAAEAIDYHRDTQNAAANGNVKATYTQQPSGSANAGQAAKGTAPAMGGNGPVHVIADRATLDHATNQNLFYGTTHAPARLWQDTDSLLAPVIEIDRSQNLLKAWGEDTGNSPVVNANFTSTAGAGRQQSVVRVHSQTLVYSDRTRQGDFHGTATAEQANAVVHSDDAVLFLKPAEAAKNAQPPSGSTAASLKPAENSAPTAGAPKQSQLDHMIATGHVVFVQPGRRGEGEKLLYTADNGWYVLTGTPAAPPHVWDSVHGTTTGAVLSFNGQDQTILVDGGKSSAVTETRARK
jgi:lipopolysaccharide export system protein LptA